MPAYTLEQKRKAELAVLKERLQKFHLSESQWKLLLYGLEDASGIQNQIGHLYADKGIGFKQCKKELSRLGIALVKLRDGRGTKAAAINSIVASTKALPEGILYELSPGLPSAHQPAERDFETVIALVLVGADWYIPEALAAINTMLDSLRTPGAGGARKQAKKYNVGIEKLAYWFSEATSSHKVSANENSLFHSYVSYWLELQLDKEVLYPENHINHVLKNML